MGQSTSGNSSSNYTTKPAAPARPNPDDYESYVRWEGGKFAEGRFRYAIKGTWIRPRSKEGQHCVVKHSKASYTWKQTDWDTTVKIYKEAEELAKGFNTFSGTDRPVHFTEVVVVKCLYRKDPSNPSGPRLNEYCTTEDYLYGNFKKWVNNYGVCSDEALNTATTMPAFMHWSWYHTGGEKMIADLQGVRSDKASSNTVLVWWIWCY